MSDPRRPELHTPGPWKRCTGSHHDSCICGLVWAADGNTVVATAHVERCPMIGHGDDVSPPDEASKANACLIAAAPELLAACKDALAKLKLAHGIRVKLVGVSHGGSADLIARMEAVIAKAERSEP